MKKNNEKQNDNWTGRLIRTNPDNPPMKGGPQKEYLGVVTEEKGDEEKSRVKIFWLAGFENAGTVLNWHFIDEFGNSAWLNKTHFVLEGYDDDFAKNNRS